MPPPPLRALRGVARSLLGPLRRATRQRADGPDATDAALRRRLATIGALPEHAPTSIAAPQVRALGPDSVADDAPDQSSLAAESDVAPPASTLQPAASDTWEAAGSALESARRRAAAALPRPSPFVAAIVIVALAVAFVGLLSYYGARKFTGDAADTRASEEARSLASTSAYTATGDAFNGYLQMLRYADDPAVASRAATQEQRRNAMQQLLFLNTNKLQSLAIVSRDGVIFATTDPAIRNLRESEAFARTRASLAPTNSDIILPEGELRGYVEFTAPLREPDGSVWAILYGRADPDRLWTATLRSSVDGSRNVILNSEGLFAAGVPEDALRQPWRGSPLDNGSVRASIAGVDSICGLGPIGSETQIDHGWHVASCLPASLIQVEAGRAMGQQALVTSAGAVLAVVLAAGLLRFVLDGGSPAPGRTLTNEPEPAHPDTGDTEQDVLSAPQPTVTDAAEFAPEPAAADPLTETATAPAEPSVVVVADVDARRVIDAYERRAARLSEQLRESVQARLLIAATQAEEAFRIAAEEPARALDLHRRAMDELDAVRDRELRSVAQELHPALIRLGLPGAIRSLQKEFSGSMTVRLEVDASTDSVHGGEGRVAIEAERRLVAFRAIRSGLNALRDAGASRCALSLQREGEWLRLRIAGEPGDEAVDESLSAADIVAFETYGGRLAWSREGAQPALAGELPAPGVALPDTDALAAEPDDDAEEAAPPLVVFAAPLEAPGESIASSLRDLAREVSSVIELQITVDEVFESPGSLDPEHAGRLRMLAGVAARVIAADGAASCALTLTLDGAATFTMHAIGVTAAFDEAAVSAAGDPLETIGGSFAVELVGSEVTVTATLPADAAEDDTPLVVQIPSPEASENEDAA